MHPALLVFVAFVFSVLFVQAGRKIGKKIPSQIPSWDPLSILVYIAVPIVMWFVSVKFLSGYVDTLSVAVLIVISLIAFFFGHAISETKYYTIKTNNPKTGKPGNRLAFIIEDKEGNEYIQDQTFKGKLRTIAKRYDKTVGLKGIKTLGNETQRGRWMWADQKNVKYCTSWTDDKADQLKEVKRRRAANKRPFSFWCKAALLLVVAMAASYGICYASQYAGIDLFPYLIYMWALSMAAVVFFVLKEVKPLDLDYTITHTFTSSDIMGMPDDQFYHEMNVVGKVIEGAASKIHEMRMEVTDSKSEILSAIDISAQDDFVRSPEGEALEDLRRRMKGHVLEDPKKTEEKGDGDEQKDE